MADVNSNNNSNTKDDSTKIGTHDRVLFFKVTQQMEKIGIKRFVLNNSDFEFAFNDNRRFCVLFSSKDGSISKQLKRIELKLRLEIYGKFENNEVALALADIEDQLIQHKDEIFKISINGLTENNINAKDPLKLNFLDDVNNLKKQFKESGTTYQQWQSIVTEKYENLRRITIKHYPEAWPFMEFCLAGKSILSIEDIRLPFMGVILSAPASMKTMIIQLFRKYPGSFYTDRFTPNSLISHNSAFTEEELQRIDMLPKMKDKLVLAPELAPIFTAKDDDLQKVLGMITRILDGHGFENDSGAQGHRRYGDTMFVWLGAAVEIPPKVWRLLGTLGHKIYFLRPALRKKTPQDLKRIAKHNNFSANNKEIEDALLDYLKTFDACPEVDGRTRVDEKGIVKIRWNEEVEQEQDKAIGYIAQIANLLAPLRGIVYLESRYATINHHKYTGNNTNDEQQRQQQSYTPQIPDGQDYDTDFPTIEDPSRAVILLRNLAIGHAISQGRDSINLQDVRIAIKVALSTAVVHRVKVLDLLLKNKGEVITSQITKDLNLSLLQDEQ